jgi:hypothetical protein
MSGIFLVMLQVLDAGVEERCVEQSGDEFEEIRVDDEHGQCGEAVHVLAQITRYI